MTLTPVDISDQFARAYKKKPRAMQEMVNTAVTQLRVDWRHPGLHTHPVKGCKGVFEARLNKGNRLTFEWEGDTIVLRNNCNHDILKRKP